MKKHFLINLIAIAMLSVLVGCTHTAKTGTERTTLPTTTEAEAEDFQLRVWVEENHIRIQIYNISSRDMLWVSGLFSEISYLLAYESTTNGLVTCNELYLPGYSMSGAYYSYRILQSSKMCTCCSSYRFSIKKPDDFAALHELEVSFSAIPLADMAAIKTAVDLHGAMRWYRLEFQGSTGK